MKKYKFLLLLFNIAILPFLFLLSCIARFIPKKIDVGLGPEPLINNVYHKLAIAKKGYSVETFVRGVYIITSDFDIRWDLKFPGLLLAIRDQVMFIYGIFRYKLQIFYFNGGCLGFTPLLWRLEFILLKIAKVKTILMPYGIDIQELTRCNNLSFKHMLSLDYPAHRFNRKIVKDKIDMWTRNADHVISGCDWVDYMYQWDTLMLAHFSINLDDWVPVESIPHDKVRILHAPNHRNIKGTRFIIEAIESIIKEGYPVEFKLLEKVPNKIIREALEWCDIAIDQLIIGWYAMFAIEAMSLGKPTICYLRDDLYKLYYEAGIVKKDEIPLVRSDTSTIKQVLLELILDASNRKRIGDHSRKFVEKYHSLDAVGLIFDSIIKKLLKTNIK